MEPLRGEESAVGGPVVTRGCRIDSGSVRSVLDTDERPRFAWATAAESFAAAGSAATLTAEGPDRFAEVRSAADELFDRCETPVGLPSVARPRLVGGFSFHHGDHDGAASPWAEFPGGAFFLPEVQLTVRDGDRWLTTAATGPDAAQRADDLLSTWRERLATDRPTIGSANPGIVSRERDPSQAAWRRQVRAAVDSVEDGSLQKVVLAQALRVQLESALSVPDVVGRLAATYPDCYRFMFSPGSESTFFGATPERLVSRHGRTVTTDALAGTTGRGDTPAEDDWLAEELLADGKNLHEHELVADTIREQLAPFTSSISAGQCRVRRLATVQHLFTPITATLGGDTHVLDLVEALHPTPAVGGLPPERALATIRETEPFDRGWYAAPVGWIDAAGNGTFAVAIRSALARDAETTLFAGVGVVADSDPDREWDEVQLKYRPILDELERA